MYLIQFSGSFLQSVLQRNRSHVIQPIGGVFAKPLSRPRHAFILSNDSATKIHIFVSLALFNIFVLVISKLTLFNIIKEIILYGLFLNRHMFLGYIRSETVAQEKTKNVKFNLYTH